MTFDHQGRRREYLEVAANGMTNSSKHFTYDNYLQIASCNLQLATYNSQLFVWDPTEPVATRPLAFYQPNASPQLYAHDGNKNVSELVSVNNGTITAHYEYSSFGEVILSSGDFALSNPFRFSSEYADDALGLVYYNWRHYNPCDGRWMGRDSIGEHGGVHLYAFCENGPLSHADSLGYGLVNYIPVISTILSAIENFLGHVPGSLPTDYSFVSPEDCKCDIVAAENDCLAKVMTESLNYLGNYIAPAFIARGLDVVITILTIKVRPEVAAIFAADTLIGGALNASAASKIMEGASNAKKNNCDCSQYGY